MRLDVDGSNPASGRKRIMDESGPFRARGRIAMISDVRL